ncbi:MAG: hypothetical protein EOO77_31140 [Oxalobacteraceae bacterium]|nr:MAG: hypothetical protein EOO77_31140 [Oxalobacteraceae bacterium]
MPEFVITITDGSISAQGTPSHYANNEAASTAALKAALAILAEEAVEPRVDMSLECSVTNLHTGEMQDAKVRLEVTWPNAVT